MPSLFSTFNILRRTMGAVQYAINTSSHNIANANTEGYSVQRATMETSRPEGFSSVNSAFGPGQLGTGVDVSEITRSRDIFLDRQIRNENSTSGKFKARDEFLSEIETIFMEPSDNGISTYMGKMWDSWQELGNNPENSNARTNVTESTKTLTDAMNHTYSQLEDLKTHSDDLIQGQVFDFNNIITQINDLNKQIEGVKIAGGNPNDILDKQDLLIDKLSEMAHIDVSRDTLAQAKIIMGGKEVTGNDSLKLSYIKAIEKNEEPGSYKLTYYKQGDINQKTEVDVYLTDQQYNNLKDAKTVWTDSSGDPVFEGADGKQVWIDKSTNKLMYMNGTSAEEYTDDSIDGAKIDNGSINGYITIFDEIDGYENQLNTLARSLAVAVNTVHNDGYLPGDTTHKYLAFFVAKDSTLTDESDINAGNITVNQELIDNPSEIHTAKVYDKDSDAYSGIGDGARALAIAQIRDARIDVLELSSDSYNRNTNGIVDGYSNSTMNISDDPAGTTFDSYFNDTITKLGSSASQAKGMVTSQDALLSQLDGRKESISGVSMDEEMTNLIQYQRAYQAAARALSMMDELLDTVVNGLIR